MILPLSTPLLVHQGHTCPLNQILSINLIACSAQKAITVFQAQLKASSVLLAFTVLGALLTTLTCHVPMAVLPNQLALLLSTTVRLNSAPLATLALEDSHLTVLQGSTVKMELKSLVKLDTFNLTLV